MIAVFDTNIVIDALNGVEQADEEYNRYERVLISLVTWMEVMAGAEGDDAKLRDFLETHFGIVPLDSVTAENAVRLRREHHMRLPDAIIWGTAAHCRLSGWVAFHRASRQPQVNMPLPFFLSWSQMKFHSACLILPSLAVILFNGACAPKPPPTPTVDVIGSVAAQLASEMLTQTAAASSPTPPPATITPIPTETLTPEPTKDPNKKIVTVINHPECWFGPGPSYVMVSYINTPKKVQLLGIGSVEGWYIVKNPYFGSPCWVSADHVRIDPDVDLTLFPIMTPPP